MSLKCCVSWPSVFPGVLTFALLVWCALFNHMGVLTSLNALLIFIWEYVEKETLIIHYHTVENKVSWTIYIFRWFITISDSYWASLSRQQFSSKNGCSLVKFWFWKLNFSIPQGWFSHDSGSWLGDLQPLLEQHREAWSPRDLPPWRPHHLTAAGITEGEVGSTSLLTFALFCSSIISFTFWHLCGSFLPT